MIIVVYKVNQRGKKLIIQHEGGRLVWKTSSLKDSC